jgi:hypothetical protein
MLPDEIPSAVDVRRRRNFSRKTLVPLGKENEMQPMYSRGGVYKRRRERSTMALNKEYEREALSRL